MIKENTNKHFSLYFYDFWNVLELLNKAKLWQWSILLENCMYEKTLKFTNYDFFLKFWYVYW